MLNIQREKYGKKNNNTGGAMIELRCPTEGCNKLLGKMLIQTGGVVEIKCSKCKNVIAFQSTKNEEKEE
jgi:phage FluMu protein Com